MKGVARGISDLIGPVLACAVGQVTAVSSHPSYGLLVTLVLRPTGQEVQARLQFPGARGGLGIFWPVAVDDEVLVVFPDGEINRAIAIPGVSSSQAKPPDDWGNDTIRIEGSNDLDVEFVGGRVTTRLTGGASVHPVVLDTLLDPLKNALTEIQTALTGLGLPTTQLATLIAALPTAYRSAVLDSE